MYSQFYSADLDCWNIWNVQTDSKPAEDYMDDDLDDVLIKAVQGVAEEKPVEDEMFEEPLSATDVSVQTESINDQEGASLPQEQKLLPTGKLTL